MKIVGIAIPSILLLLGLIQTLCVSIVCSTTIPQSELDALHDFYIAMGGDDWLCDNYQATETHWDFSGDSDPCTDNWVGITCTSTAINGYYHVEILELYSCNLVGTISPSIRQLTVMQQLMLVGNAGLTGWIPDVFDNINGVTRLDLGSNSLTGSLPPSLAQLGNLTTLSLSNNELTGRLDTAFNPALQRELSSVTLSNNVFTGQLPDVVFQNPSIQSLSLEYNCFSGTLPEAVCDSTSLIALNLRCLACASRCTTRLVDQSNYLVHHHVHGTVPHCVFGLPQINDLTLSDNCLSGQLPAHPNITSTWLSNIDISHNALTGTVPAALLTANSATWGMNLDLSSNRLTGRIDRSVIPSVFSSITLSYNRMSGPAFGDNWSLLVAVDVLTGNLFACHSDESRLPAQDTAYGRYTCGSDNFNSPLIAWLCALGGVRLLGGTLWYYRVTIDAYLGLSELMDKVLRWRAVIQGKHLSVNLPSLVRIRDVAFMLATVALTAALGCVVILAPVYAGLTAGYGTYKQQYAWNVSAVLLSGRVPFAVCFVCFLVVLSTSILALFRKHATLDAPEPAVSTTDEASRSRILLASAVYLVVNFFVVAVVNVAFVATSVYTSAVYQVGISVFKVGWNLFVSPYFSRWLAYELSAARADWFTLELFVSIMNNIGIPLLAVLFVSPQCLYYLLGGVVTEVAGSYGAVSDYDEPFYYSYQCSYVFLDYYAAAFVYAALMATFGTPLLDLCLLRLLHCVPEGSLLRGCVTKLLPRSVKPMETDPARIPDRSILRPYFDAMQFLVAQFTSLALILTLGVVFPPVAAPVALTMVTSAAFVLLKAGRLLANASAGKQQKYVDIIELECANVATPATMRRAFWMLLWFGCWFYTLFLFDTLGDAVGFERAYWVLVIVPLLPMVSLAVNAAWEACRSGARETNRKTADSVAELPADQDMVVAPFDRT